MKHAHAISIAIVAMMATTFFACTKEEVNEVRGNQTLTVKTVAHPVQQEDTLRSRVSKDQKEEFVGNDVKYSFTRGEIRDSGTSWGEAISLTTSQALAGVDPQHFDNADVEFTTAAKGAEAKAGKSELPVIEGGKLIGTWSYEITEAEETFEATNASKFSFEHKFAEHYVLGDVVFTFAPEEGVEAEPVVFKAPSRKVEDKQLKNENVTGVVFEGKTYEAVKYAFERVATYEIASEYRVSGTSATLTLEATNVAYFRKHVVDTRVEGKEYTGKFFSEGREVKTEKENVKGALVTRDNGEIVKSEDFSLDMNLYYRLSETGIVWVNTEEELYDESLSVVLGEVAENTQTTGVFTGKTFSGVDTITLSDRTLTAAFGWSNWAWGTEVFPYAMLTNREEVKVSADKNIYESTDDMTVVDVKISAYPVITYVGVATAAEPQEAVTVGQRRMMLPDDIQTILEVTGYELELQKENAAKVSAKRQANTLTTTTTNRGKVQSTSSEELTLDLWTSISAGDTVTVSEPFKPAVISVEEHANKGGWIGSADVNGFQKRYVQDSQTIRVKGGNALEYEWYYEVQGRDGKDAEACNYAEVSGAKTTDFSFSDPVLVDSTKTAESVIKLYRVDARLTPNVTTNKAMTKASSNNMNTYAVSASFYQKVVEGDEYIEGKDVPEWYTKKDGDKIIVGGRLYETYTLSGKVLVDEKEETLEPSLKGVDATDQIVKSAEGYVLTGNGLNKTGNGTYHNYLTKGSESYPFSFDYNAPANATVKLNGRSGKGASKTFEASFALSDNGLSNGSSYENNGYTVYPRTSNVKAVYAVESASVELTASSTRNLLVAIPQDTFVSDRIEKTEARNGNSVNWNVKLYETWSLSGEKLKDEKSGTLTPSLIGSNGGEIVVVNTNITTTGNGHTGTGNGSYTDNASNGTNGFSNSYSFNAPASVSVQLNGTNGTKTVLINTTWVISEAGQTIGTQTVENGYYVYDYSNAVKGVYTVENTSVELEATATKTLKVKREVPKIIPESWGKIRSAAFSCVPAHDVNGNFVDGNGPQTAAIDMTIVTDKGAVPVVFAWADRDDQPVVPTVDQILSAHFSEGSYSTDYNSAFYNSFGEAFGAMNNWVPAIARDADGINYSIPGYDSIRDIRGSSLVMWGWRGGNYSYTLPAYNCTVDTDGNLTVTYNGKVVLELR